MRRAIGIVRVSQTAGREGESFASPRQQAERVREACERDRLELLEVVEELDVSGGTPLEQRHGLRSAVEAVEEGRAEVIVAAYFDRLVRSLRVQDELVSRVERAGGQVLALDVGAVTSGTAGQWLSGTMLGAVAEYHRRTAAERSGEAQARAVARGVLPYPNVPPGYRRLDDGTLEPDPDTAEVVAGAFRLRAGHATVAQVRAHLKKGGVDRSYHGTQALLKSRVVLGEIHFGGLSNLDAHEPIVDPVTWRRVQQVPEQRGPKPKSDRLLARVGVLVCGTCGARMVVGASNNGQYPMYRCPPVGDCPKRMTVSAVIAETVVVGAVKEALGDLEGRASVEQRAVEAERELERAQSELDAAIRAFTGLEGEQAAVERLRELSEQRDHAQREASRLGGTGHLAITIHDWDRLSLEAQRALIRAVIARAVVTPGRGAGRIRVELVQ